VLQVLKDPSRLILTLRSIAKNRDELNTRRTRLLAARTMLTYAFTADGGGGDGGDGGGDGAAPSDDVAAAAPDPYAVSTEFGGASRAILDELLVAADRPGRR
jgi:hypothetical protein